LGDLGDTLDTITDRITMENGYSKSVGTRISCGKAGLAYLGTLGDPLPESSNRGQVQLDEIQPVSSNEVLHQVDKHCHILRLLYYDTIMH
jgi:hypothetical protein